MADRWTHHDPGVRAIIARAVAEERERIAAAIGALPTTRTKAWLGGWDSVSLQDALSAARGHVHDVSCSFGSPTCPAFAGDTGGGGS